MLCYILLPLPGEFLPPRPPAFILNFLNSWARFWFVGSVSSVRSPMCRSVGIDLALDDFQSVSDRVPLLADFKPSGKYVMEDLHKVHSGTLGCDLFVFLFVLFVWIG